MDERQRFRGFIRIQNRGRALGHRADSKGHASRISSFIALSLCLALVIAAQPFSARRAGATINLPEVPNPIAAVTMACSTNGVDLNSASLGELQSLPGVNLDIAKRIVAARPFLRPNPDLLVVSGIGPDKLKLIMEDGRVCAEPPTLPPPVFDVCNGDGRIDVNRPESKPDLVKLFGKPTAGRIVAGIPYWKLSHVQAEGEGGAGSGKFKKLMHKLCLTPPTIDHAAVRWGWIDSIDGGFVEQPSTLEGGTFLLTVPPGVVDEQNGAWGSVTPVDVTQLIAPGVPAAEIHLHGAWEGDVYVGLPPDGVGAEDPGQWRDTMWHQLADGSFEIHWGDAVERIDDHVTTTTDDLSVWGSFRAVASQFGSFVGDAVVSIATWVERVFRNFVGVGGAQPSCSPDITDTTLADGSFTNTEGELLELSPLTPAVWHCITPEAPSTGIWRFVPNRGVAFRASATEGALISGVGISGDWLVDVLLAPYNLTRLNSGSSIIVGPGVDFTTDLAIPDSPGTVNMSTNLLNTLIYQGLAYIGDALPGVPAGHQFFLQLFAGCTIGFTGWGLSAGDGTNVVDSLVSFLAEITDCLVDNLIKEGDEAAAEWAKQAGIDNGAGIFAEKISRALAPIKAAKALAILFDQAALGFTDGDIRLTYNGPPPGPQTPPSNGGGGLDGTLPAPETMQNLIIGLQEFNHSDQLVLDDYVGHDIIDASVYDCLARRYLKRDWLPEDQLLLIAPSESYAATCNSTLAELPVPAHSTNWILRQSNGAAYYLDAAGLLYDIESQGVYICLAQKVWVADHRELSEIAIFGNPLTAPTATCS